MTSSLPKRLLRLAALCPEEDYDHFWSPASQRKRIHSLWASVVPGLGEGVFQTFLGSQTLAPNEIINQNRNRNRGQSTQQPLDLAIGMSPLQWDLVCGAKGEVNPGEGKVCHVLVESGHKHLKICQERFLNIFTLHVCGPIVTKVTIQFFVAKDTGQ